MNATANATNMRTFRIDDVCPTRPVHYVRQLQAGRRPEIAADFFRAVDAIKAIGGDVRIGQNDEVLVDLPSNLLSYVRVWGQSPRFRKLNDDFDVRFASAIDMTREDETACILECFDGKPERRFGRAIVLRERCGSADRESVTVVVPV